MKRFLGTFGWSYPEVIAYMLQATEYMARPYMSWYWRTPDFGRVMHRRVLDKTRIAQLIILYLRLGIALTLLVGGGIVAVGLSQAAYGLVAAGTIVVLLAPLAWALLVVPPVLVARRLIIEPRQKRLRQETRAVLEKHPAVRIAVAGSYGKTTVKEVLAAVLAEGKRVAATPANKNVASSHANFVRQLRGDEEVIIIEYGESRPGDIRRFIEATTPQIGIITGLAPAHLDQYKTLEAAAQDIITLAHLLPDKQQVYINGESPALQPYIEQGYHVYTHNGLDDWRVENVTIAIEGTSFDLTDGQTMLHLKSGLLGGHLVGVLAMVAVVALRLGLTPDQVAAGIAKTKPYAHRMQPYKLGAAWVIDDAYNGNIEGVRAGTELLAVLSATRKIYVTPGLVDQGSETAPVHVEMGQLIAAARPDVVVLMRNSVTAFIQEGLEQAGYQGEVRLETDPLGFYNNLAHFVAAGDVVILQNDWTDNYT
jgi:UDP-N-acetylmuramoyl-tripeptide--D-alanyl-D-alanine ligase